MLCKSVRPIYLKSVFKYSQIIIMLNFIKLVSFILDFISSIVSNIMLQLCFGFGLTGPNFQGWDRGAIRDSLQQQWLSSSSQKSTNGWTVWRHLSNWTGIIIIIIQVFVWSGGRGGAALQSSAEPLSGLKSTCVVEGQPEPVPPFSQVG